MKMCDILVQLVIMLGMSGCNERKFRQTTGVMEPTIHKGDVIYADLKAYKAVSPSRWDVVVYKYPYYDGLKGGTKGISRVVGLPGEIIDITTTGLLINGNVLPLPSTLHLSPYRLPSAKMENTTRFPYRIPPKSYFLMGDNVDNSLDSRYFGALSEADILGNVAGK